MKYKHFCHVDTTVAQHHTCWTFITQRVHQVWRWATCG